MKLVPDFKQFIKDNTNNDDFIDFEKIDIVMRTTHPNNWFWSLLKYNCNSACIIENKWQKALSFGKKK